MKLNVLFYLTFILLAASCSRDRSLETRAGLSMAASLDRVIVAGLPPDLTANLSGDAAAGIFSVYRDTTVSELRDLLDPVPGRYHVSKDSIVFKPDSHFSRGSYFARFYIRDMIMGPEDLITGKNLRSIQHFIEYRFVVK